MKNKGMEMQESRGCAIYKNEFVGEGIEENQYSYFCLNLTAISLTVGLAGGFSCNRAEAEKPWKGNACEAESVRLGYPSILRR